MSNGNPVIEKIPVARPTVGLLEMDAIERVVKSGRLAAGPEVELFEEEFARYIGTAHAVAVSSGTAALHATLHCLGVGRGDKVLVPPLSFFATIEAVLLCDAEPEFVDVEEKTWGMCPTTAHGAAIADSDVVAMIPVHYLGQPANFPALYNVAALERMYCIEDAAQAHGARDSEGLLTGSLSHAGCFSFYATKHLGIGEGGMVTTDLPQLADRLRAFRNHGMSGRDVHATLGLNYRMSEMQAAIGRVQLSLLEERLELMEQRAEQYMVGLEPVQEHCRQVPTDQGRTWFWFPVRFATKEKCATVRKALYEAGIETRYRYDDTLNKQPVLERLPCYHTTKLRVADHIAGHVLGLPMHPGLTEAEVARVLAVLTEILS